MASYNKVLLMGNLTRDPQLRYLPSQMAVVDIGLACSRKFKTQTGEEREETLFVDCSAFGRTAEVINQYFQKGRPIFVEGRLKYDTWEDKNGGGKRSKLSVVIDNFQFIGAPPGAGGPGAPQGDFDPGAEGGAPPQRSGPPQRGAAPRRPAAQPPQGSQEPPISEEAHFKPDDIPF